MRCTIDTFVFLGLSKNYILFVFFHFRMLTERTNKLLRFLEGKEHNWWNLKIFISKNRFCGSVTIIQLKVN